MCPDRFGDSPGNENARGSVHAAPTQRGYRPEIEGLRAAAVLAVVLFHLDFGVFRGGFVGVDIFFVISGYLITRNILMDIDAGKFSFLDFYSRRVRRLFPALLFTAVMTLVLGALWFSVSALSELARGTLSSLVFVSNVYFWFLANEYFAPDAYQIPILHLWSLSVEEQFYLVWPALLVLLCWAVPRRIAYAVTATLGILSLTAVIVWHAKDPAAVFYLTPFRIYQFVAGAAIVALEQAWAPPRRFRNVLHVVGILCCAWAILGLRLPQHFASVVAALGAALVIYAGNPGFVAAPLTNRVATNIGHISYSLYLCHWPIVVFALFIFGESAWSFPAKCALLVIMLAIATLMYSYIEQPFRSRGRSLPAFGTSVVGLAASAVAVTIVTLTAIGGWPWRLTEQQSETSRLHQFGIAPCIKNYKNDCVFGDKDSPVGVILIGDSYAEHYVAALDRIAKELGVRGEGYLQGGCLVLDGLRRLGYPDDRCEVGPAAALAKARASPAPVIMTQAWIGYRPEYFGDSLGRQLDARSEKARMAIYQSAIERTVRSFGTDRRVLIIGAQVLNECRIEIHRLQPGPLPHAMNAPCRDRPLTRARADTDTINAMLARVRASLPNQVTLLLPQDYVCEEGQCRVMRDGLFFYQDAGHMTVAGSLAFGVRAHDTIADFIKPR